jgi:hypothetical protein
MYDLDNYLEDNEDWDFEDVDCEDCGIKFYVRPSAYVSKPWPTKCTRCTKGLPPLYEY